MAVAAALAVAATACSGSGEDKAGGQHDEDGTPVVLTLEQHDPGYGGAQFADAVAERSGGSIRIAVRDEPRGTGRLRAEDRRRRPGRQCGPRRRRGSRLDTLGVTSFSGLIAPFLVDSMELQRRSAREPARSLGCSPASSVQGRRCRRAARPLRGVRVPPRPRRPRGLSGREDRRSAGPRGGSDVPQPGANTRVSSRCTARAARGPLSTLSDIAHYEGRTIATNVVFWPRAETVVMNREAFDGSRRRSRPCSLAAGREAVGLRMTEIDRAEKGTLRSICEQGLASLVTASPGQVAGLHGPYGLSTCSSSEMPNA